MRTRLLVLVTLATVAAAPGSAAASICDLYYDVTAWPRWSHADPACGLGMLSEYQAFEIDRLTVEVSTGDGWVAIEATIEESVLPLTVWWGACNEDCTLDEWTEEVDYLHYQITPAEPWPAGSDVRLVYLDPYDELDRELTTWRIAEPDAAGECHTSESIWDPGCYQACPCDPDDPDDDPPDDPGDDEGEDDPGIYGCSAAGGSGAAAWLIALVAVGLRRGRRARG